MGQKFTISFVDGKDFKTYNTMLTLMRYWCKGSIADSCSADNRSTRFCATK